MAFSPSRFSSLSIRPPTPPKDVEENDRDVEEVLDFLSDPFGEKPPAVKLLASQTLLNTPEQSPSSDSAIPSSSASRKKRVNFHAHPCTIPTSGLAPQTFAPLHSSPLRPLPQTRVSKPLKSILKPADSASTPSPQSQSTPAHRYKSFAEMLESIMKQLALGKRPSSLDAYHALHRTMQAYDKIPDIQALQDKMGLLTQFISRDVQAVGISGTGLDSQLITQALKLLMALVRVPELRSTMDDEFCTFIIDRSILAAGESNIPKAIVNTHLAVLMQQNFRPKTMTAARVERILDALDTIQQRISGLSVLAYRIRIYRKLIQQRPDTMARHSERWFKNTVKALLSTQKDINQSALDTAISAAKTIGTDRQVIKSVLSVLNRRQKKVQGDQNDQKQEGDSFATVIARELEKMLKSENASMVPQIWSAITALLHNSLKPELFHALADWLRVFEQCLNSTNDSVKIHTNIAFGFLVYGINIGDNTPPTWHRMLVNVPQHQLKQRGQWKKTERESATCGYFTLLYYALNPMASHKQLDMYWSEFVADFWDPLIHSSSPVHTFAACRVVSALLNGARKPLDQQRALDLRPQAMIQRVDLPVLDPKWVRKSVSSILKFVETLLDATPWTQDDCKDEPAKTMWLSLLHSLNVASSQEVMSSTESKDAMAHIVNLLRRVWDKHATQLALSQQKEESWANKFCFLLETVVEKLGALQFADKCLARNGQNEFEVASTPSARSRQQGPRVSPLIYFVDLLVNQSEGKLSDAVRLPATRLLIEPCFDSQNTRLHRLELLRDCAAVVKSSSAAAVNTEFWAHIANLTKACIEESALDSNERVSQQLGKEYDVVVEILSFGSSYLPNIPSGREVLTSFTETVRREAGEGAVVLAVIERVSECILRRGNQEDQSACLPFLSILLRNLPTAIVRWTIEQGRQNLWPLASKTGRNPDFDPYGHFYDALVSVGSASYHAFEKSRSETVREFLAALANALYHCPIALLAVFMRKIQETIRIWVEDADGKLQKKDQQIKSVHLQVVNLWKEVCSAIERLPRKDGQILLHLEPLITAGFLSRRRGIANISIATWNATFGREKTLRYPARLEQALRRIQSITEISLPSLQDVDQDYDGAPSFYDSDDSSHNAGRHLHSPRVKEAAFRVTKSSRKSRSPVVSSEPSKRSTRRQLSRVRLRHDNSQIHFEPIVSSPTNPFNQESQVLTERQREMVERQAITSNLFAELGSTSSPAQPNETSVQSPIDLTSDAMSADDLPMENSRTPLKSLPSLGPMDVFVGSSPTPQARDRTQQIVNDQASVTTPSAVRSVRLDDNENLGSSPPQLQKLVRLDTVGSKGSGNTTRLIDGSFEFRQPERTYSVSFDEGTTVEDEALPEAETTLPIVKQAIGAPIAQDYDTADMPSSSLELQLTAQFDADMQAHVDGVAGDGVEGVPQESENIFVDAASHQLPARYDEIDVENDTEVEDTQIDLPTQKESVADDIVTSSTSRVGDSFSSQVIETESPQIRTLRRSTRSSAVSSPSQTSSVKRRGPGRPRKNKVVVVEQIAAQAPFNQVPDDDRMLDNIVVAMPNFDQVASTTARQSSHAAAEGDNIVPKTLHKRAVRRSASLLSQVEIQSGDVGEDTSATKRRRQSLAQDVSEAKPNPRRSSRATQAKRLSHVRVSPSRSSEMVSPGHDSVIAVEENTAAVQQATSANVHPEDEEDTSITSQPPIDKDATREMDQCQSQPASGEVDTPSRSFAERVILTPRSIINQLRNLKEALFRSGSQLLIGMQDEHEIDDELFHIRREVHAAGKRAEERGR